MKDCVKQFNGTGIKGGYEMLKLSIDQLISLCRLKNPMRWISRVRDLVFCGILLFSISSFFLKPTALGSVSARQLLVDRNIKVDFLTLKNGIRLLVVNDPQAKVISFANFVKAGGVNQIGRKHGLAHLFEHLMFKGSQNYPDKEFLDFLDSKGSVVNAMTQRDQTIFYEIFAKEHLDDVLKREVDRLLHLSLTLEQLTIEKKVVISERLMRVNQDPKGEFLENYFEKIYKGTPYDGSVIGQENEIISFTLEECDQFYKMYYRPDRFVIGLYGPVSANDLRKYLEKEFSSSLEQSEDKNSQHGQLSTFQVQPVQYFQKSGINNPNLIVSYPIPSILSDEKEQLDALNWYLFQKGDAYLSQILVEKLKVANGISSQLDFSQHDSYWHISMEAKKEIRLKNLLDLFDKHLLEARKKLAQEKQLALIGKWSKFALYNEIDEPFNLLSKLMYGIYYFNDPWRIDRSLTVYEKLSESGAVEKLLVIFDKYLNKNSRSLGGISGKTEAI